MSFVNKMFWVCLVSCFVLISGCAALPENIAPDYVNHEGYLSWECDQLSQEQERLAALLSSASDAQRKAREHDNLGVLFLGVPIDTLSGENQKNNIARLKGEMEAVQKATILKKCGTEILAIEKVIGKKAVEKKENVKQD